MPTDMDVDSVPVEDIEPNPYQPRQGFDEETIDELADSIEKWGLLQPVTLRSGENGTYQLIAGERRWRAAQKAGAEELPAIIKDVGDEQQQVESLIENVHRESMSMLEKGRAAYQVFLEEDIDLSPKTLANKVNYLLEIEAGRKELSSDSRVGEQLKRIERVCDEIAMSKRQIRSWLKSIAVSEDIQDQEIEAAEDERVPGDAIARISSIDDEELQEQVYEKAKEQGMGAKATSKFVTKVKKLPEEERERVLQEGVRVDVDLMGQQVEPEIPDEERERILSKVEQLQEETEEILADPKVQERGELRQNWQAHSSALNTLGSMECPVCGNDHTKLVWACEDHDNVTVREAQEIARREYQNAIRENDEQ